MDPMNSNISITTNQFSRLMGPDFQGSKSMSSQGTQMFELMFPGTNSMRTTFLPILLPTYVNIALEAFVLIYFVSSFVLTHERKTLHEV